MHTAVVILNHTIGELAVVRYAIEMYSHQEDIFYGHLCLGGSKWPTSLKCWHLLFALSLSGFGEGSYEKGHWEDLLHRRCPGESK